MTPKRLMNRRGEYRVNRLSNEADAESSAVTEILLYDEIGYDPWFGTGVAAKTIVETLNDSTGDVHLRINSPGGDVFEGIAMMNALRRYDGKVTAFVDGLAASAASIVAMGADEVVMSRQSELMIHDAWGIAIGNAEDMDTMAADLNRASDNLAAAYSDKAGGPVSQWRKAMRAETWYSDKEAVSAGLADRVEQSKTASDKAKARFNLSLFAYAGRAEAPAPFIPAEPETTETKEGSAMPDTLAKVRARLGLSAEADESAILAALETVASDNETDDTDEPEPEETDEGDEEETTAEAAPGTVTIDEGVLNNLISEAKAGREDRAKRAAIEREQLVMTAVREGRISVARKADWLNKLEKDPGSETELSTLAKGLVPVDGPRGYTGSLGDVAEGDDEMTYKALFGEAV